MKQDKMSDTDKIKTQIKRWGKRMKKLDLDNFESFKKELFKVRQLTLRRILLIRWFELDFFNNPNDLVSHYHIKKITEVFKCTKRQAYDYLKFFLLYNELGERSESALYKSLTNLKPEQIKEVMKND